MTNLVRITSNPNVCGGRLRVRGMHIRGAGILERLAEVVSEAEILADFPYIERDSIHACPPHVAHCMNDEWLAA